MASGTGQHVREEIRLLLRSINQAWTQGRPEDLAPYFRDDMVIVGPGFQGRTEGKQACIESYKEFISQATIRDYEESEIVVDVWGETAVASYHFEIDYEMGGTEYHDTGYDLFVFVREGGLWRVAWRTLVPLESQEREGQQ